MTTNFRALISRMADELDYYRIGKEGYDTSHPLAAEARLALAAEPEPPTDEELISPIMWMLDQCVYDNDKGEIAQSLRELIARWGHLATEPEPPADGEVAELVEALRHCSDGAGACGDEGAAWVTARAAELLERLAPVPVPVGERLPGERDVNEDGNCWLWDRDGCFWDWTYIRTRTRAEMYTYTHWLPANSVPIPKTPND